MQIIIASRVHDMFIMARAFSPLADDTANATIPICNNVAVVRILPINHFAPATSRTSPQAQVPGCPFGPVHHKRAVRVQIRRACAVGKGQVRAQNPRMPCQVVQVRGRLAGPRPAVDVLPTPAKTSTTAGVHRPMLPAAEKP